MINYMKSELYRISRMKGIYILNIICLSLLLIMNIALAITGRGTSDFPYDSTAFSFSMVQGSAPVVFILTACMGAVLFADEYKHRTLMNSVAYGYSRQTIYFGKMLSTLMVAVISLAVVLGIYIASSYILLENSGIEPLLRLLKAYGAEALVLICGHVAAITLMFMISSSSAATWTWLGVFLGFPSIANLLRSKFAFFEWLKDWLVYNIIGEQTYTGDKIIMIHDTMDGLQRCLIAGGLGTICFLVLGVLVIRKKEMK